MKRVLFFKLNYVTSNIDTEHDITNLDFTERNKRLGCTKANMCEKIFHNISVFSGVGSSRIPSRTGPVVVWWKKRILYRFLDEFNWI